MDQIKPLIRRIILREVAILQQRSLECAIAEALQMDISCVNVKATTEEGLGFTGKKEGISAQAICCISKALDLMPDDRIAGGCSGCPGCAKNAEE